MGFADYQTDYNNIDFSQILEERNKIRKLAATILLELNVGLPSLQQDEVRVILTNIESIVLAIEEAIKDQPAPALSGFWKKQLGKFSSVRNLLGTTAAPTRKRGQSEFNLYTSGAITKKARHAHKNNLATYPVLQQAAVECARNMLDLMTQLDKKFPPPNAKPTLKPKTTAKEKLSAKKFSKSPEAMSMNLGVINTQQSITNPDNAYVAMINEQLNLPDDEKPPIQLKIKSANTAHSSDIDDNTRLRRQEKTFTKQNHMKRAQTGQGKTKAIISDPRTFISILENSLEKAGIESGVSNNTSRDYQQKDVVQNILDKQAVFANLTWTRDFAKGTMEIQFNTSDATIPQVEVLGIETKTNATTNILTEVTLTQKSYLNVAHVAVTEELAKAADCLHAQFVEITSVDAHGMVYIPGIIEGVKNALYANLIPILDKPTQDALTAAKAHPQVNAVISICDVLRQEPNNAAKIFAEFEAKTDFLSDPYKAIRSSRKKRI